MPRSRQHIAILTCTIAACLSCMPGIAMANATTTSIQDSLARLERAIITSFQQGQYRRALAQIDRYLEVAPADSNMLYNAACAHSLLNEQDKAAERLLESIDAGFKDFDHMQGDPDLANLRSHPTYQAILEARRRVDRRSSSRQLDQWRDRFGEEDYVYETDDRLRLHFATALEEGSRQRLRRALSDQADHLIDYLFEAPPTRYALVAIPKPQDADELFPEQTHRGIYEHARRRLIARDIGMSLQHEFVHLMHYGHMERIGQQHPIWIQEGIATLYEDWELDPAKGTPIYRPNMRHNFALKQVQRNRAMRWEKLFRIDPDEFMDRGPLIYPQVRSIFEFIAEKVGLDTWYDAYVRTYEVSPSGTKAFVETFQEPIDRIEDSWKDWVRNRGTIDDRMQRGDPALGIQAEPTNDGAKITRIMRNSPAGRAGLRTGDVIIALGSRNIGSLEDLQMQMNRFEVGDRVLVTVRRDGEQMEVVVRLQSM